MLSAAVLALPRALAAQRPALRPSWQEAAVGSELEAYLRALQLDSGAAPVALTVRPLPPAELLRLARSAAAHPWRARFGRPDSLPARGIYWLRPTVRMVYGSAFPIESPEDGPVWAGRGATVAMQGGVGLLAGPLHVRVAPVAFRAQNDAFPLYDERRAGDARFRDPLEPEFVDNPQRFGAGAYQRVDLGTSEVRLTAFGLTAGGSTAPLAWGPMTRHPLMLGGQGPGFLHAFFGTARPLSIGIGRVHGALIAGRMDESPVSPIGFSTPYRGAHAMLVAFTPRGLEELELGATRFFHRPWRGYRGAREDLLLPLRGFLFKAGNLEIDDPENPKFDVQNELASLYGRWRLPRAGVEVYGEYLRNDAALDIRDLIVEPDHASGYGLGLRKALARDSVRRTLVWGELVNARLSHIDRVRPQARLYQHSQLVQGHTQRGRPLGSTAAMGGAGASVGVDHYTPRGRVSADLSRVLRLSSLREGAASPDSVDVQYALTSTATLFRGPVDLLGGATLVYELNRNYRRDAVGLRLQAGARVAW
ncbi:hypothetical protein rosag_39740 [Roseisolibacter agri]|uniref:Capsule assembly protein Wzi n=1 Tax=Roseisolibacter agri TaxID=2014610 RepID=A0AA37V855_9BACT|nr:hypothetical protein rosag_39740 [Roseisolibacter agri]